MDIEDRTVRRRVDGRDGNSVQVTPLRRRFESGVGHPDAPIHSAQERMGLSHTRPAHHGRPAGAEQGVGGRDAGGARPPRSRQEYRTQAVCRLACDHGQGAQAAHQRCRWQRHRRRRQVRRHPEPHRRPDRSHRLRPGGDRRAAGEPHALQSLFPGKARLFSRGARHLRLRSWRHGRLHGRQQCIRHAQPLLLAPNRTQQRRRHSDHRGWPADGKDRAVGHWPHEHRDRDRRSIGDQGHELQRHPAQARRAEPQFDRRHGHRSLRGRVRQGIERRVRRGWFVSPLAGTDHRHLLGTDNHHGSHRRQSELSGAPGLQSGPVRRAG